MAYITLNKKHFFHNLDIITNQTKSKDKIALVLKDNAYGHGLLEIASMAKEYGIKKAVVRCEVEAQMVKGYFETILVLAHIPQKADRKICYTINDITTIKEFPKHTKVQLKVDTGMNRNGIEMDEMEEAFAQIALYELFLEAVFTHHSSADELTDTFTIQKQNFHKVKQHARALAQKYKIQELAFHSCNSAALFRTEDFDEDMARIGIGAYGCLVMPQEFDIPPLKPVLSLYGAKLSTRVLQEDECVGYSATYKAKSVCCVSNYDVGYADGFMRSCSNHYVTPEGVDIAGRISMDNSSFLSDAEELLIFDDAKEVAKFANTIAYEVLTSLKNYITRKVV